MRKLPKPASAGDTNPHELHPKSIVEVDGLPAVAKAMEAAARAHELSAASLGELAESAWKNRPISFEAEVVERDDLGRIKRVVFRSQDSVPGTTDRG